MSTRALLDLIDRATAQGILPADAREQAAASRERPWPVVVLTFVGAFLASIPLAGFFLLMFEWALREHASFYVLGILLVTLGVVLMRVRSIPLFFEQWGVIAFAAGFGMLWFVLIDDLDAQAGNAAVCVLALALALALPAAWMRASLALLAGAAFAIAFLSRDYHHFIYDELPETTLRVRLVILAMLALWWAAAALVDRTMRAGGAQVRGAQLLAPISDGWLVATLALVILSVGNTFLMGSFGGQVVSEIGSDMIGRGVDGVATGFAPRVLGVLCAFTAAAVLLRAWPALRSPLGAGLALAGAALSWAITALGAVLLIGAICARTRRDRLAILACVVAVWVIGAFYYLLALPLATKALLLTGIGAGVGLLAWAEAQRRTPQAQTAPDSSTDASASSTVASNAASATEPPAAAPRAPRLDFSLRGASVWVLVGLAAVLAVANYAIADKERVIAHGRTVYVELIPVDPRSLMQGDYMALNFRVPNPDYTPADTFDGRRPKVIAKLDARGVATVDRLSDGAPPTADEVLIELTPGRRNDWMLVTNAWYFREGEAERWAAARYGEFRVLPDGRALLVGMADAQLARIE